MLKSTTQHSSGKGRDMPEELKPHLRFERRELLVEDVMTRNVITVTDSASISEAAVVMKKNNIGCVVVKRKAELLGIVTERDLIRILASDRSETSSVTEVASKPLIIIGPKEPVKEAARILVERGVKRLPVVDGTRLVGILTSTDLFKLYYKLSKHLMKSTGP